MIYLDHTNITTIKKLTGSSCATTQMKRRNVRSSIEIRKLTLTRVKEEIMIMVLMAVRLVQRVRLGVSQRTLVLTML